MAFEYEVVDLGCDHAQFFPGFGTAFSKFDHSALGGGESAKAAGEDALDQVISALPVGMVGVAELSALNAEIEALSATEDAHKDCDHGGLVEDCEWYHYVGIRWKVTQ